MKFLADRTPALNALASIVSIVKKSGTIPILNNVRMAAAGGRLTFTACDLDMQGSAGTDAKLIETPGVVTVPADMLLSILRNLPEGADFSFEHGDEGRGELKAGRSRFKVPTLPADAFPTLKPSEGGEAATLTIGAKDLARLLSVGGRCQAEDEMRPYLATAYLHTMGDVLRAVSTEGHRLTYCDRAAPAGLVLDPGAMVPAKTLTALQKLLTIVAPDDAVELDLTPFRLRARVGAVDFSSKLLDHTGGGYPNYMRMFTEKTLGTLSADTDLLIGAVRRALIASEKGSVRIDLAEGGLTVAAGNSFQGASATDEIDAEWDAEPYAFKVDGPWLLDMLDMVSTERVTIRIPPDLLGMRISETGESDWVGLLSPQRL